MDNFTLYENMTTNPNYMFKINGGGVSVSGAMQNELSIAGANEYGSAKELSDAVLSALPMGVGDKISKVMAYKDLALRLGGRSTLTDFESRLVWNGSSKPQFSIEYKLYNLSSKISTSKKGALQMAKNLQMGVLPDKGKPLPTRKGLFYKAPLGYKFANKSGSAVKGTVTLEIGNWFVASRLVIVSTNFTPSIQVMKSGQPLFVTGSVTLEPCQLISYKEFEKYFR